MKVIRRKSRLLRSRWIWYIQNSNGVIVSKHFHSKEEATEFLDGFDKL